MVLSADTFQQNYRGYDIQSDYSQSDTQAVKQLTFTIRQNGLMLRLGSGGLSGARQPGLLACRE